MSSEAEEGGGSSPNRPRSTNSIHFHGVFCSKDCSWGSKMCAIDLSSCSKLQPITAREPSSTAQLRWMEVMSPLVIPRGKQGRREAVVITMARISALQEE